MPDSRNFVDEVRTNVESLAARDVQALSEDISREVVEMVRAALPRAMASNMMRLPDGGELGWNCTGPKFSCGEYSCVGAVGCTGEFSCTVKFTG
jgi:hypothetical protein